MRAVYRSLRAALMISPMILANQAFAQVAEPVVPGAASAQDPVAATPGEPVGASEQASDQIGDIVVTAQRREQRLQSVPIAISAFGEQALIERAVVNVASLGNLAPSTTLTAGAPFSGSSAVLSAFIRGIGSNDFRVNLDPGVGVYLDGVYLARTIGANVDLPDVQRVEILKGPQGTLFGRNSIGGAISVVTRNPADTFAIHGNITTGSFDRLDAQAAIDVPLTDRLTSLVTVAVRNRRGFLERVPFPSSAPFAIDRADVYPQPIDTATREGGDGSWTLRGKLRYDGGAFRAVVVGDYMKVDQSALNNSVIAILPLPGAFAGLAANNIPGTALDPSGRTGFNLAGLYNFCIGATPDQIAARNAQALCGPRGTTLNPGTAMPGLGSVNVDADPLNNRLPYDNRFLSPDIDRSYATGNSYSKTRSYSLSATLEYDISDAATIKSITGYRNLDFGSGMDGDGSPIQHLELSFEATQNQFSQEVQLLGHALSSRLNYVVGAYYFRESATQSDLAVIGGVLPVQSPYAHRTKNFAMFGQADWRITDFFGVTMGGRYTTETKRFEAGTIDLNGFLYKLFNCTTYGPPCSTALRFPDPADPLDYYPAGTQDLKFNNFSPKVGVDLHPTEDVMLYGSWSRGYKTGSFDPGVQGPTPTIQTFGPEEAETFEIGVKSTLIDRHLQLNVAAFTTEYQNIQLNYQQGTTPTIRNAGTARIKGIEAEITARFGGGMSLNASAGYTDARFTEVQGPAVINPGRFQAGVFVGSPLPKTPEWKFNVSPRHEFALGSGAKVISLVDYTFQSKTWNDTERTFLLAQPDTNILAASIAYAAPGNKYRVTLGGTNLLDQRFITNGLGQLSGGLIYGNYSRPREWYLRFDFQF